MLSSKKLTFTCGRISSWTLTFQKLLILLEDFTLWPECNEEIEDSVTEGERIGYGTITFVLMTGGVVMVMVDPSLIFGILTTLARRTIGATIAFGTSKSSVRTTS